MSNLNVSFPPPTYWQQFEDLTLGLFTAVYGDKGAQKVGRPGQAQDGVDVFGYDLDRKLIAIQCKRLEDGSPDDQKKAGGPVSEEFFEAALQDANSFTPTPEVWILATTAKADKKIQAYARKRSAELGRLVQVWDWDHITILLNKHIDLQRWYYQQVLLVDPEAQDRAIIEVFATAFQRAAFRTPIYGETPEEFLPALKDVQHALSTGEVKDRETRRVMIQGPGGWRSISNEDARKAVLRADSALQQLREVFRMGEEEGDIRRCGTCLDIDLRLRDHLDQLRRSAVEALDEALVIVGLPKIDGGQP